MVRLGCALLASLVLVSAAHGAERRVALVIGNSAYKNAPLINPGNDVRAVAQALREMGFAVDERRNLNQAGMRRAIRQFGDEIAKGGVGLFYYAGHGMQIRGRNFLVPVGSDIQREDEVEDQGVDARLVLEKMASARNVLNIVILDACRNNPFASSFRSATVGLAAMDAPAGTLIAFSTAPGQVAADGADENGLYTKHLVAYMREPGLKVEDVFKRVRAAVRQESGGAQTPWENTSLERDFYFKPPDPNVQAAEEAERQKAQQAAIERAVQEALKRRSEETRQSQAQIEKQIAERVAVERALAEKEARARIAAIERAAREAIERARREGVRQESAEAQAAGSPAETTPGRVASAEPESKSKAGLPSTPRQAAGEESGPLPASAGEPVQASSVSPGEPVKVASAARSTASIAATGGRALPKVGDTWRYKITTRDYGNVRERKTTVIVRAVTDTEIHMGRTRVVARYTHDWNILYSVGNNRVERTYEPNIAEFRFPLVAGSSWQTKFKTTRSDGRAFDVDMDVTALGWESVSVPAGTFKAFKLTSVRWYRRTDPGSSGGGRTVINRWYAPEVKRWVKSETLDVGNNGVVYNDSTAELTSYKVQ